MSNRKLLLADDSVTIQKVVNLTFADEGVDVVTFGDGDSALAALRDVRPDVVMADVNMPGASGYKICEAIRSADDLKHIPVILLVGSFEQFDAAEAERVGANSHLTKPFQSIRQLVAQVTELMGSPGVQAEEPQEEDSEPSIEIEIPMIAAPQERSDDIDALYERSVTGQAPSSQAVHEELGDPSMDDEMIETHFAYEPEPETEAKTVSFDIPAHEFERQMASDRFTGGHEFSHSGAGQMPEPEQPPAVWEPERERETRSPWDEPVDRSEPASDPFSATYGTELRETEQRSEFREASTPGYSEPETYEPPHMAQPYQEPAGQPEAFSGDQDHPQYEPPPSFEDPAPAEPNYMGQETVAFERGELDGPAPGPVFEEVDLLDLPPLGSKDTVELTTPERAELMGSNKQVVTISPELMEIIVQQVVERLSRKY